ncbi:hypothetical protein OB13_00410 [Pontibacter sp. HJ8]
MCRPYAEIFKSKPVFRVTYTIFSKEEGGRFNLPSPGIRWDFWYEQPAHSKGTLFMFYPEFKDSSGNLITDPTLTVPKYGNARMWILAKEKIEYHRDKIRIGTHGYFMEGNKKVGACDVIELINLK